MTKTLWRKQAQNTLNRFFKKIEWVYLYEEYIKFSLLFYFSAYLLRLLLTDIGKIDLLERILNWELRRGKKREFNAFLLRAFLFLILTRALWDRYCPYLKMRKQT